MAFAVFAPTVVLVRFHLPRIIDILVVIVRAHPCLVLHMKGAAVGTALLLLEARLAPLAACAAVTYLGLFERVSVVIHGKGIVQIGTDPCPDIHFAGAALAASDDRAGRFVY